MAEETLDAILAEMRGVADNMKVAAKRFDEERKQDVRCMKHPYCFRHDDLMRESTSLRKLADRIEVAARRAVGNAGVIRETLEKIRHEYCNGLISCRTGVSSEADVERVSRLFYEGIDTALSAPARNCDVGTAEEQAERFKAFCDNYHTCSCCPLNFTDDITACPIEWSQMPFAPEKGDSK